MLGKKKREKKNTQKTQHPNKISSPFSSFPEPSIHRYDTYKHLAGLCIVLGTQQPPPRFGQEMGKFVGSMFSDSRGRLKNDLSCTWRMFLGDECDFFSGKNTRKTNTHTLTK